MDEKHTANENEKKTGEMSREEKREDKREEAGEAAGAASEKAGEKESGRAEGGAAGHRERISAAQAPARRAQSEDLAALAAEARERGDRRTLLRYLRMRGGN